jgi:hypothetical protein
MGDAVSAHFRSDSAAAQTFDARAERDPAGAVRFVHARGLRVDEGDVPPPFTEQLAALPANMRLEFKVAHDVELSNERTALTLARGSAGILGQRENAAGRQRAAERSAWIAARAAELIAADDAARRERFRAIATAEFDGTPPPAPTSDTTTRPRRATDRSNARS